MGIFQCKQLCQILEKEEKLDIINYNNDNENNSNENKTNESSFSQQIIFDENYLSFKKSFDEKLPLIGKYISLLEFETLIPNESRKYMAQNILDISKYLTPEIKTYEIKPVEFFGGNVYKGNWNEKGEMQGYGQYYLKDDKVLAEGVWEQGCLIFARVFLPNGDLYEGGFQNSIFNGYGKLVTNNGEIYEGNFVKGEKTGLCTYLFPDGTIFNGNILNGLFNGEGSIKWNNGIKYEGNFINSTLGGFGVISNLEGDKYEGFFEKNLMNGKGKYYYDNRDIYEGNYEEGKRSGKGIYIRNDGLIYDGEWSDDLMNGFSKIKYKTYCFKCIYRNGEITEIENLNQQNNCPEDNYNNIYNLIVEFKPQDSGFYNTLLSHLDYENNIISQYGPEILPSFMNQ